MLTPFLVKYHINYTDLYKNQNLPITNISIVLENVDKKKLLINNQSWPKLNKRVNFITIKKIKNNNLRKCLKNYYHLSFILTSGTHCWNKIHY